MAARKTTQRKAVRPSYENKAVVPAGRSTKSEFVNVRVVKAHDGLEEGQTFSRPTAVAREMCELGYWEII